MSHLKILAAILCPWWLIHRQNRVIEAQKGKIDALSDVLANPTLTGFQAAQQQLEIGLKGPMCEHMAAVLGGLVAGCPEAENYLELSMCTSEGRFVVIVTRPSRGRTPHQLRVAAEQKAQRLEQENAKLRHALEWFEEWEGQP